MNLQCPPYSIGVQFSLKDYLRIIDGPVGTDGAHSVGPHEVGLEQFNKLSVVVLLCRVGVQAGRIVKHVVAF